MLAAKSELISPAALTARQCSFSAVPERFLLNDVGLGMHNEFPLPLVNEVRARALAFPA